MTETKTRTRTRSRFVRSWLVRALVGFLLGLSFLFVPFGNVFAETQKVKIGVSTALSGDASSYGFDIRDAILFANEKYGQGRYEFIFEDDKCSAKEAVAIANKFVNVDKVDIVMGYACSGAALAAAPILERAKIPTMITSASAEKLEQAGDYIFRTTPNDRIVAEIVFAYIKDKHKSVSLISEETEYAQGLRNGFLRANAAGRIVVATQDFTPGTTDFRTILLKIKSGSPEAIVINGQTEASNAEIAKTIRELGLQIPIYGFYFPGSPVFLKIVGKNADGIEYGDLPPLGAVLTPEGQSLLKEFVAKYGQIRSVEFLFVSSFEGLRAIDAAVKSGQPIKDYLYQAKFDGIFGPYSFDSNGEIQGLSFVMKRIKNGQAELIN